MKLKSTNTMIKSALLSCMLYPCISTMALAGTAPYPQSKVIQSVSWDLSTVTSLRKASGSDIWPSAWAADGNLYGAWGDGGGFNGSQNSVAGGRTSLGFALISGTPVAGNTSSFTGTNIWGRAPAHAKYPATFGGKVSEMFSVDGVLYGEGALWTSANCNCSDPTDVSGSNQKDHTLVWSSDLGKSWKIAPWKTASSFGSFLQYGQDYQGAADPDHLYFYYSGDANSDPSHVYLRRMSRTAVTADPATPGHFEYFTGVDSSGSPFWSTVAANAQPVFTDAKSPAGEGTGLGVVFDAPLGRYVAVEGHGEQTGQIGVFESPTPWGPWATIAYYDDWGGFNESAGAGNGMYFPSKWISSDGLSLWAVFSGLGAFDSFNVARMVLKVSNTSPQISTPVAGTVLAPGQSVTARGTGSDLSWSVSTSSGSTPLSTGKGASTTFTVPENIGSNETIRVVLTGSGGSSTQSYSVQASRGQGTTASAVGHWTFDAGSGTSAVDSSGAGDTGTLINGPGWTAGVSGEALRFDGNQTGVRVAGSGSLANLYKGGLTVSAWIRPTTSGSGGRGRIVDKDNNDAGWFFSMYSPTNIQFAVDQFDGSNPSRISTATVDLNRWQHVVATWDGSTVGSNIHLYVDGVSADGGAVNGAGAPIDDSGTPLTIGNRSGDLARGFAGDVDEVQIYNRVLSPAEIRNLAAGVAVAN
jgi:hypothetical protein